MIIIFYEKIILMVCVKINKSPYDISKDDIKSKSDNILGMKVTSHLRFLKQMSYSGKKLIMQELKMADDF